MSVTGKFLKRTGNSEDEDNGTEQRKRIRGKRKGKKKTIEKTIERSRLKKRDGKDAGDLEKENPSGDAYPGVRKMLL